jgi:TetR/AcrR family transcriptional regulator, transcriptional repressor of aconitase
MAKRNPVVSNTPVPPKRLTRDQRKAQTRERLIEVGRQHIIRHGLGDAVAERIAEDAGYSRGAFYANFEDKEDLFLAVVENDQAQRFRVFRAILEREKDCERLLQSLRESLVERVMDPEWIILQAEFEAGALRSEKIRRTYVDLHRRMLREGRQVMQEIMDVPGIHFALEPNDFLLTMLNFTQGMAVSQRLLGSELSQKGIRNLIRAVFDQLVITSPKPGTRVSPTRV